MPGSRFLNGKTLATVLLGLSLSACVGTAYSGPVEVTRFVGEANMSIGQDPIAITFPEEMSNVRAKDAFYDAVAAELVGLGYTIAEQSQLGAQTARVTTKRSPLAPASSRGPVSVGVGGSTGSYGSGLGVGIGIDLGGNTSRPNALSELSVRISDASGNSVWEGRAQQAISINSPYADVEASAGALAAALFKGFPGGEDAIRGETVSIELDELQE
ncbi:hypothetical protein [uncultured Erythrobacter sp.]|uniref:hypothetical protein n=1 Tax=uncultured Erythrobacter sp. TaxID=263913 RepID=UPI002610A16F|nr:hypothetical protein [uncultured Erythrobacter sp.]